MSSPRAIPAILCADIGTSSLKAALVDYAGSPRAFVRETYPAERVAAGATTAADWEDAFLRASRSIAASPASAETEIVAVCVSGNGPTLVPVLGDGSCLPPLHWHDGKTAPLSGSAAGEHRPKSFFLPRAAWLRDNAPGDYARVRRFLSCQEWFSARLGAEEVGVLASAAYRPYFWDAEQIAAYGLVADKFPPLVLMGESIGKVSHEAARAFSVPAGIPIVAAGTDYFMALVGAGVIGAGMVCDRAGTSEGINVCAEKPARTAELLTLPQLRPELWHVSAQLPTTGRIFEWFRVITGQTNKDYRDMLAEIEGAAPRSFSEQRSGGGFFFPDVRAADRLSAASAFVSTAGLTTRPELGRAVVEAIGFMVRRAIETLERHGYRIDSMRLSGGQAKNDAWNRLKADITGRCLAVPEVPDGELVGNACAALVALGEAADFEEAVDRTVRIQRVYEPDQKAYALHSERYDAYRAMQTRMEHFFG